MGAIPVFYPSMLNTYRQCPSLYHHRYVERQPPAGQENSALRQANALHSVLAQVFREYQRACTFPVRLQELVTAQLPRESYPSERAWGEAVEFVLGQVKWALMSFDHGAEVLAVERTLKYAFAGRSDVPAFELRAKVDLVLRHTDGSLEHIDWKTGKGCRIDQLQNTACRIVVGQTYTDEPVIRSTTAFLATETTRSDLLTRDQVRENWTVIKEIVSLILAETAWLPTENPLCEFCPLYEQGCKLFPGGQQHDQMTAWLEDVA